MQDIMLYFTIEGKSSQEVESLPTVPASELGM